ESALQGAAPSLHQGAARLGADAGARPRHSRHGARHRLSRSAQPAVGLPLPPALSRAAAAMRERGAADPARREGHGGLPSARAGPSLTLRRSTMRLAAANPEGDLTGKAPELCRLDAGTLFRLIARRDISAREVVGAFLDHIAAINPTYNAIVSLRPRED